MLSQWVGIPFSRMHVRAARLARGDQEQETLQGSCGSMSVGCTDGSRAHERDPHRGGYAVVFFVGSIGKLNPCHVMKGCEYDVPCTRQACA